jgi:hypothetical protein
LVRELEEKIHLGDLDVDYRIILKRILREIGCEIVDWIQVAEFRSVKLKIRVHLVDLGEDDKIILKRIL